ncbi:MAG TPA: cupin domain-containing protein [Terrimicrobiaceae bacterium]|nr:cupin domain-containing protein [Terrimicrobiaceae bacterium]
MRSLRKARGLTQSALAVAANVTKGYLSKIEGSPTPPTFSTLQSIATALGMEVGELLTTKASAAASPNLEIHAPGQGSWQQSSGLGGYSFLALLESYRLKYLSPFLMKIKPGTTSFFKHDGEEFLFVLEGTVDLEYEGQRHPLRKGASAYLDSRIRHRFHNSSKSDAQILAVNFVYRRF